MAGVATVQREGLVININLQPYVILLFTEFLFFHLKQKKKNGTKPELVRQLVKKQKGKNVFAVTQWY